MQTTSKQEAIAKNIKHYFTGEPCLYGHISIRLVSSGGCVECSKISQQSEKSKQNKKLHYLKNREKYLKAANDRYAKDPEPAKKRASERLVKKRKEVLAYQTMYRKKKELRDPVFALSLRMKQAIRFSLFKVGAIKNARTMKTVGCSLEEFKLHIERQFYGGMSWDNKHKWHIDHIIPLATAKTEQDVIALNHFSNLRPLWAKENLAKGAKNQFLI